MKLGITFFIVLIIKISFINSETKFVFELFRHGARAPIFFRENTPTIDLLGEHWTADSQLTGVGMRQHYLLGYRDRIRYDNFISKTFDPNEILIKSTDSDRTIASAQSHLLGLFPPGKGPSLSELQKALAVPPVSEVDFEEQIKSLGNFALPSQIQPVPIHIFPRTDNYTYLLDGKCQQAKELINHQKRITEVVEFNKEFDRKYGEKLRRMLNVQDLNYFSDYDHVHNICDTFYADYYDKRELKEMVNVGIKLEEFYQDALKQLKLDVLTVVNGAHSVGYYATFPIAMDLYKLMDNRIKRDQQGQLYDSQNPKMVLYSAHDTNVASFLSFLAESFKLEVTEDLYPGYASSILVELNKEPDDYYVKIMLDDRVLFNKKFEDFKSKVSTLTLKQVDTFCRNPTPPNPPTPPTPSSEFNYFILSTAILGAVALIELIVILCRKKNNGQVNNYNSL